MQVTTNHYRPGLLVAAVLALAGASACGGDDTSGGLGNACGFSDPDCLGCAELGECCLSSGNCPVATICNLPTDPLYEPSAETGICLKVTCDTDADCDGGKVCSLEKLCKTPVCQVDGDCTGGDLCIAGACAPPPDVADVATCEVVTKSGVIAEGESRSLAAIAKSAGGAVVPGVSFEWSSSDAAVVSVDGAVATGGQTDGAAILTASVQGASTACDGEVALTNYAAVGADEMRVVTVIDGSGLPLEGATVVVMAGDEARATTDAAGVATFSGLTPPVEWVTVVKAGYEYVTVIEPGTDDVFLPVPAATRPDTAGGFRGIIDISQTDRGDIQVGFAGPALPTNLLDFGLEALVGDLIPTEIEAPELSLDLTGPDAVELPGGLLASLGPNRFMADGSGPRCQGVTVSSGQLGCFLARAPEGRTAGWALAGQLKLKDITPIISTVSDVLGGEGDLPIGDVLVSVLPLLRNLSHAIVASLDITYHPTVDGEADYSRYQRVDMTASQELGVLSVVDVPDLPGSATDCADAAIILGGAILDGRGLVPLGVTAGLDTLDENESADCRVAGIAEAFGSGSADTQDGQMALSLAPLHGGAEGSETFLLLVAADSEELLGDDGLAATALVQRTPNGIRPQQSIAGPFLDLPAGEVDTAGARITLSSAVAGATLNRYELQTSDATWLVYAPPGTPTVELPMVTEVGDFAGSIEEAYILSMKMNGSFADAIRLGSGMTLDRLIETVDAFSVQQCSTTETAACRLR